MKRLFDLKRSHQNELFSDAAQNRGEGGVCGVAQNIISLPLINFYIRMNSEQSSAVSVDKDQTVNVKQNVLKAHVHF